MKNRKLFNSVISIALALAISIFPCLPAKADVESTYYIKSQEDLIAMAENCRLDTNSRGRVYILANNIELQGEEFNQIPVFRGSFDGDGHTISGFKVTESLAPAGLFGIIESDGVVENLRVRGSVMPEGDGNAIGGIAGINRGRIENCEFYGNVNGKEEVGGIAGINDVSGIIKNSSSSGRVTGLRMSGGISGNNHGLIDGVSSFSYINHNSSDPTINIEEIESGMQSAFIRDRGIEKIYSAIEDCGGIAGFSDGIITNCINEGDVGYVHIGYNLGGIVGRNQGFIYGCNNQGIINGRREVGGIVGQAEPFVTLVPNGDNVENIRQELHNLQNLVNKATSDVDGTSANTSARLTNINNIISDAGNNVKDLSDILTNYLDENLEEVNRGSDILKSVTDRLNSISGKLPGINDKITNVLDEISRGMEEARRAGYAGSNAMGDFSLATEDLNAAVKVLEDGGKYISDGVNKISEAITVEDNKIENVDRGLIDEGVDLISKGLEIMENGSDAEGSRGIYAFVSSALNHLKDGMAKLKEAGDDVDSAVGIFENSVNILSNASSDITGVLDEVSSLTGFLSNTDPLQFSYLKSRTERAGNDLNNNMTNLSRELEALNGEAKSFSDTLMADIRAINDQFFLVMDLLLNEINDVKNVSLDTMVEDVSDEDINSSTDGKVQFCANFGDVSGDIDVGGITGSMGIFNKQNPEEENITINEAIRARYKLKAILQDCTNYGDIFSKKDYVGCITGISSLGVITDCKGYGKAVSGDGDYAGGISGGNSTTIRNSYAKAGISAKKYVGGITGLNSTQDNGTGSVINCVAAVEIPDRVQYSGAICGYDEGVIKGNYFFGNHTGINNASYTGKAEPVSFDELCAIEGIPGEFKRFKVTFVAGDKVIREVRLNYMESYEKESFPEIPPVEGEYGKWDSEKIENIDFDKIITAEYYPYVTALASDSGNQDSPSKFMAIGKFSDESKLVVREEISSDDTEESVSFPAEPMASITPVEICEVSVADLKEDNIFLRYYGNDLEGDSLVFYVKSGESWERVESKAVGSYYQFEVPSGTNSVLVASRTGYTSIVIIMCVLILFVLVVILIIRKKRCNKHRS